MMIDHQFSNTPMRAILIHGMGHTPISMLILARRLRAAGIQPHLFAYSATLERWQPCVERLRRFIAARAEAAQYIVIGHSLGCVLTRAVLPQLARAPEACFFLAPPMKASTYAKRVAQWRLFRMLTGEMGQLLAQQDFMDALPLPSVPVRIYAGTSGPRGRWLPLGDELNDGILSLTETQLASLPVVMVPTIHTFIMNSRQVTDDIVAAVRTMRGTEPDLHLDGSKK
ncbi:esterase/lipase family protein [Paraherbaspirillum soli]|uniref:Esterase/lipase family protein n=1 Tax=Paraherbaspirillum soli TaxID=631222 RepID=A0ABW0M3E2_9BURK